MKTILTILSLLATILTVGIQVQAAGVASCDGLPRLREEVLVRRIYSNSLIEYKNNFQKYLGESEAKEQVATAAALTAGSAAVMLGAWVITIGYIPTGTAAAASGSKILVSYFGPRVVAGTFGVIPGIMAASLVPEASAVLTLKAVSLSIAEIDNIYLVARSVYNLVVKGKTYELPTSVIKRSLLENQKRINQLLDDNRDLLNKSPGMLSNALSLGRENSDFYSELAKNANEAALLGKAMYETVNQELSLLERACGQ